MEDHNIYKKVGRKYIPFGVKVGEDYLTDGIWLVRHKRHSTEKTRVDYLVDCYNIIKVGNLVKLDLPRLCAMEEYADVVVKTLLANYSKPISNIDLARRVVKDLFDHFDKTNKK